MGACRKARVTNQEFRRLLEALDVGYFFNVLVTLLPTPQSSIQVRLFAASVLSHSLGPSRDTTKASRVVFFVALLCVALILLAPPLGALRFYRASGNET